MHFGPIQEKMTRVLFLPSRWAGAGAHAPIIAHPWCHPHIQIWNLTDSSQPKGSRWCWKWNRCLGFKTVHRTPKGGTTTTPPIIVNSRSFCVMPFCGLLKVWKAQVEPQAQQEAQSWLLKQFTLSGLLVISLETQCFFRWSRWPWVRDEDRSDKGSAMWEL